MQDHEMFNLFIKRFLEFDKASEGMTNLWRSEFDFDYETSCPSHL